MGAVGRLFLAIDLSADTRHALLAGLEGPLDQMPGRIVTPPNWHLTLRFLGEVGELVYDKLVHEMSLADLGASFDVSFGRLGAFPRPERATVLWVGIRRGDEKLRRLAHGVETAVGHAGLRAEDRPFRAHLTLSRIRPPHDLSSMLARLEGIDVKHRVDAVTLFKSHLGRGGASYEPLEHFPLRSSGQGPRAKG